MIRPLAEMPWPGPDNLDGITWTGPIDAAGRPDGHGVVAFPADDPCEFQEGRMAAGRVDGWRVVKRRDGRWWTQQLEDDEELGQPQVQVDGAS